MGQAGQEFAWVAARPVTGRTHQIRVHLASLGTPIVGDFKYGGTDAKGKGAIADKLHLHARSIDIARPDGGRLQVTAPLAAAYAEKLGACWVSIRTTSAIPFPPRKRNDEALLQGRHGGRDGEADSAFCWTASRCTRLRGSPCCFQPRPWPKRSRRNGATQDDEMRPAAMPLTRLVNTVLDGVRTTRRDVIAAILRFGENDLLSYRAESAGRAGQRASVEWNDLLDWACGTAWRAAGRHLRHPACGAAGRDPGGSAAGRFGARDDFDLAALHVLASITRLAGSGAGGAGRAAGGSGGLRAVPPGRSLSGREMGQRPRSRSSGPGAWRRKWTMPRSWSACRGLDAFVPPHPVWFHERDHLGT